MIQNLFPHHIPYIEMIGQMDMGGVLLAVKSDITSSEYSKCKNIEFIAAKIQLSKQKPQIIGSSSISGRKINHLLEGCVPK
jgi:hypothetical protein